MSGFDQDGFLIPDPQPTGPGVPDPRYPQKPPGVSVPGKNFAYRPELATTDPRGQAEGVLIGPGSEQWTRGADAVLNKRSLTVGEVMGPRRRRRPR
jgi:hypothetical protein